MTTRDDEMWALEDQVRVLARRVRELEAIVKRIPPNVLLEPHEMPMSGAELAEKHGFKPHGRDPLTGGVLPSSEEKPR